MHQICWSRLPAGLIMNFGLEFKKGPAFWLFGGDETVKVLSIMLLTAGWWRAAPTLCSVNEATFSFLSALLLSWPSCRLLLSFTFAALAFEWILSEGTPSFQTCIWNYKYLITIYRMQYNTHSSSVAPKIYYLRWKQAWNRMLACDWSLRVCSTAVDIWERQSCCVW